MTGFYAVYRLSKATSNAGNIFAKATGQWIMAFFTSTLSTNLMSSGERERDVRVPYPPEYYISRITGISHLDGRPQCLFDSRYEWHYDVYIARSCGCRSFVLCGALHHINLFCLLEQWTVYYARHGDSAVNIRYRTLLSFD